MSSSIYNNLPILSVMNCDGLKLKAASFVELKMWPEPWRSCLDGHTELICRFNLFLPKYWHIEIEEEEDEELHPDESAAAAAGLIQLKEGEQAAQAGAGLVAFAY